MAAESRVGVLLRDDDDDTKDRVVGVVGVGVGVVFVFVFRGVDVERGSNAR